jgi:hypothetical protein
MNRMCDVTHPLILAGKCPRCGCVLGDADTAREVNGCVWNIPAMATSLDDARDEVRIVIVSNLFLHSPPAEDAIPLLSKAISDKSTPIRSLAENALSRIGDKIAPADFEKLESQIPHSPHELALRMLSVGYYRRQRDSDLARKARNQHVFWLIEHAPDTETAGQRYADLYRRDQADA